MMMTILPPAVVIVVVVVVVVVIIVCERSHRCKGADDQAKGYGKADHKTLHLVVLPLPTEGATMSSQEQPVAVLFVSTIHHNSLVLSYGRDDKILMRGPLFPSR